MVKKKEVVVNASIFKRLIAFIIDLLLIDLVIAYPITKTIEKYAPHNPFDLIFIQSNIVSVAGFFLGFLTIAYFMLMELKTKQTIGKMLFNLYVQSDNKKDKAWQYFLRSAYFIPLVPFVILWLIEPIYIFFDKDSRRLTEKLSHTKTVEIIKI